MLEKTKILIVDDDENIAELINLYLAKDCYDTFVAHDGEAAIEAVSGYRPNLMLLDIMLPGMDGYDVLKKIRKTSALPVILLSAKGETFDKVLGLELGADDYIMKPFDPKEMVARVKAVLRRYSPEKPSDQKKDDSNKECASFPDIIISQSDYSVTYYGHRMEIPPKELELFYFLASHPNQVFTREQLLSRIWGYDYAGDTRTIDVHIKRLREKFAGHPDWDIKTVWGIGYKFEYYGK